MCWRFIVPHCKRHSRWPFGWKRFLLTAVTKKIQVWSSKGDVFLRESQNEIHLPTIISVTNLSLILVSNTNKCAYVSLFLITTDYKRSSCLPFSWTETDFPSLTHSLRSQTPKRHSCDPQKAMWFCMKQRISSLDRDMHVMQEEHRLTWRLDRLHEVTRTSRLCHFYYLCCQ